MLHWTPPGDQSLRALVAQVMAPHLDANRPLWQMWQVDGLAGGRWAVVVKAHHTMVDGRSGADLVQCLLTGLTDAPPPPAAVVHAPSRCWCARFGPPARLDDGPTRSESGWPSPDGAVEVHLDNNRRWAAEARTEERSSAAGSWEPASISAARCSGPSYIGGRSPVRAHRTSRRSAAALS